MFCKFRNFNFQFYFIPKKSQRVVSFKSQTESMYFSNIRTLYLHLYIEIVMWKMLLQSCILQNIFNLSFVSKKISYVQIWMKVQLKFMYFPNNLPHLFTLTILKFSRACCYVLKAVWYTRTSPIIYDRFIIKIVILSQFPEKRVMR